MKYSIGMLIVGLLVFIISPLVGNMVLRGLVFRFEDLTINISATFFSLALLTGAYQLFGEEQTVILLKQLLDVHQLAKSIAEIGLRNFSISRSGFDPKGMESDLLKSSEIFLISKNFEVIKYKRVQDYFAKYLHQKGTSIRLIISSNATAIDKIHDFRNILRDSKSNKFLVKEVDNLNCGMYGGDDCIFVTLYLSYLAGDESPAFKCAKEYDKFTLYSVYKAEFEALWATGKEI